MNRFDTAFQRFSLGLDIEGIAARPGYNAYMWLWGDIPDFPGDMLGSFEVIKEPLSEQSIPTNLSGTADYWTGQIGLNAPDFNLDASPETVRALCSTARRPVGTIIDGAGSSIEVVLSTPPALGDVIWVGDETLKIGGISPISGSRYYLTVGRGYAQSSSVAHEAGADIYADPPYYLNRRMRLRLYDNERKTMSIIWQGLLSSIKLDEQQLAVKLSGADTVRTLLGAKGGSDTPWSVSGKYLSDGTVDAVLDANSHRFANENQIIKLFRVGDCLMFAAYDNLPVQLGPGAPLDLTFHDKSETEAIGGDEVARELLVFLRRTVSGVPVETRLNSARFNCFEVYGNGEGNSVEIALQLLCSTGTGQNGPYDTLGADWGVGVPWSQFDQATWLRHASEEPVFIDRLILNWDGKFSFEDVVINRLLTPFGLRPVPDSEGLLTLKKVGPWEYDTVDALRRAGGDAFVLLTPQTVALDYHTDQVVPRVAARLGQTPYGGEVDTITATQLFGNRTDYLGASSPYVYDLGVLFKSRREEVQIWLSSEAAKRRVRPPTLSCVVPLVSRAASFRTLDGPGRPPGLLDWVLVAVDAQDGAPSPMLVGPDGSRIAPNGTDITFAGLVVSRTLNFADLSVELEVVLASWDRGDRVAMLIGPGCRIIYADTGEDVDLDLSEYEAAAGGSGFIAGDDVVIVDSFGLPVFASGSAMTLVETGTGLEVDGINDGVSGASNYYLRHSDYSEFDNPNLATVFYQNLVKRRKSAFLADDLGNLNSDPGDEYV